jgi:hypothetical protein
MRGRFSLLILGKIFISIKGIISLSINGEISRIGRDFLVSFWFNSAGIEGDRWLGCVKIKKFTQIWAQAGCCGIWMWPEREVLSHWDLRFLR